MKRVNLMGIVLGCLVWFQSFEWNQIGVLFAMEESNRCLTAEKPDIERADRPYGRYEDLPWMSVQSWCERFDRNLHAVGREQARVVFFGDSITEGWSDQAPDVWQEFFGDLQPLQLGIGGDQTQQLLWRLEQGELDGLQADVLVLLIGVNNIGYGGWSEQDTAAGVEAVLKQLRLKRPDMTVLHLAILPAMADPGDSFRQKIATTNSYLSALKVEGVRFVDIGAAILEDDGRVSLTTTYDYLHPNREGYRRLAERLRPLILDELGHH